MIDKARPRIVFEARCFGINKAKDIFDGEWIEERIYYPSSPTDKGRVMDKCRDGWKIKRLENFGTFGSEEERARWLFWAQELQPWVEQYERTREQKEGERVADVSPKAILGKERKTTDSPRA